jgi:hypothetical protein
VVRVKQTYLRGFYPSGGERRGVCVRRETDPLRWKSLSALRCMHISYPLDSSTLYKNILHCPSPVSPQCGGIKHLYGCSNISPFFSSSSDPANTHAHTRARVCTIIPSSEIIPFQDRWSGMGLGSLKFMVKTWVEKIRECLKEDGKTGVSAAISCSN